MGLGSAIDVAFRDLGIQLFGFDKLICDDVLDFWECGFGFWGRTRWVRTLTGVLLLLGGLFCGVTG